MFHELMKMFNIVRKDRISLKKFSKDSLGIKGLPSVGLARKSNSSLHPEMTAIFIL